MISLIPLREYLKKFQRFLDFQNNNPFQPRLWKPKPYSPAQCEIKSKYLILEFNFPTPPTMTSRHRESSSDNYDWNLQPLYDLQEYFPYSSGPSSPSSFKITSEDEEVKWRIKYDCAVKKHRTNHPEFDHSWLDSVRAGCIPTTVAVIPDMIGLRTQYFLQHRLLRQIYSFT